MWRLVELCVLIRHRILFAQPGISSSVLVSDNDATAVQVDLVKGLGADQVINYKEQNWGEVLKGQNYDAIFDCVGVLLGIIHLLVTSFPALCCPNFWPRRTVEM
jgi:threonine dehydrogenase-like Zn-dependent dehydrogenase